MKKVLLFISMILYYLIIKKIINRGRKKRRNYDWSNIDINIYWFGRGNKSEEYIEGQPNKYFDKNKPKAMSGFNGNEIRLVGHSLGAQVVINGCKLIEDDIYAGRISDKLRPQRIALLDTFWTKGKKSYINLFLWF